MSTTSTEKPCVAGPDLRRGRSGCRRPRGCTSSRRGSRRGRPRRSRRRPARSAGSGRCQVRARAPRRAAGRRRGGQWPGIRRSLCHRPPWLRAPARRAGVTGLLHFISRHGHVHDDAGPGTPDRPPDASLGRDASTGLHACREMNAVHSHACLYFQDTPMNASTATCSRDESVFLQPSANGCARDASAAGRSRKRAVERVGRLRALSRRSARRARQRLHRAAAAGRRRAWARRSPPCSATEDSRAAADPPLPEQLPPAPPGRDPRATDARVRPRRRRAPRAHRARRPARRRQDDARRALARELGVPFVELDREIEREAGTSLSELFMLHGQAGYRRFERRCLERVLDAHAAAGDRDRRRHRVGAGDLRSAARPCFTVWVKATPEEHMARVVAQGDFRPMEGNREAMDDLHRILAAREPLYARADAVVDTAGADARAVAAPSSSNPCAPDGDDARNHGGPWPNPPPSPRRPARHLRHAPRPLPALEARARRRRGHAHHGRERGWRPQARLQAEAQLLRPRRRHRAVRRRAAPALRASRGARAW